jgi:hypothetical protein
MAKIELEPIGVVRSPRGDVRDDEWGGMQAQIVLDPRFEADALDGIDQFSHAEILFFFDRVDPAKVVSGARHPRNNRDWPAVAGAPRRRAGCRRWHARPRREAGDAGVFAPGGGASAALVERVDAALLDARIVGRSLNRVGKPTVRSGWGNMGPRANNCLTVINGP